MRTRLLLLLLLPISVRAAGAQQVQGAAVGATTHRTVRLFTPGIPERRHVVGELVESGTDALTVRTGAGELIVVPRTLIRRYEESQGRTPRGSSVRRAMVVGIALGALAGAVLTPDTEGEATKITAYTLSGAAAGAAAGFAFGTVNRPEQWKRADVPLPR